MFTLSIYFVLSEPVGQFRLKFFRLELTILFLAYMPKGDMKSRLTV